MWHRHKEQIVGVDVFGTFILQIKVCLWSLTACLIRTIKETTLSGHLGGTLALTLPPPVTLTSGIEATSQQVAPHDLCAQGFSS